MKEQFPFLEEVKRVFEQAALIGKTLKDLYFYGDDPFLNKQHMVTIFNNLTHNGAIRARKIKKNDIPDDITITRGRASYKVQFLLVLSDGSAIRFNLKSQRPTFVILQPGSFTPPRRKNNVDEHRLFSPVFDRTIKEYRAWTVEANGIQGIRIEISFSEGLLLHLSDIGVYVMKEHNVPMKISIGEYRKMVPGYIKLFDKKRVLFRPKLALTRQEEDWLSEEDRVAYKLEQAFFDLTNDVESTYKFMSSLKTLRDRQEVLETAERDGGKASLMELAVNIGRIHHRSE